MVTANTFKRVKVVQTIRRGGNPRMRDIINRLYTYTISVI